MRDDVRCEKCEKMLDGFYSVVCEEIAGISTELCGSCTNLWEDYVLEEQIDLYRDCRRIENELESIKTCFQGTGAENIQIMKNQLTSAEKTLDKFRMRFRNVAKEWLADTIETVEA